MTQYCVIVAGNNCARFFDLLPSEIPELESGPNLIERRTLTNEARASAEWSELKSGRNRAPGGGGAHGYDDHRDEHVVEFERRFAREISTTAEQLLRRSRPKRLVLVAENRMLGHLRRALDGAAVHGVMVQELAKDLCGLSANDIHEHLAREGLLPQRRGPAAS